MLDAIIETQTINLLLGKRVTVLVARENRPVRAGIPTLLVGR